jgi:hypothetical protein
MADDIEAELKAAGKELDKVRYSCPTICCQASSAANKPPGRGNRAYEAVPYNIYAVAT